MADQMGLGKTNQVLVAARHLLLQKKVNHCIFMVTKGGLPHWENQIRLTFGEDVDYIVLNKIAPPERRRAAYKERRQFYLVTLETFREDVAHGLSKDREMVEIWKHSLVCIDEIHKIGNTSTKANRAALAIAEHAPYRWGISGTPMDGALIKLYGVMAFLDRDFFIDKRSFIDHHCIQDMWGSIKKYKNEPDVEKKLKYIMIRRLKKDVRDDLPEKTYREHYVELTKDERSIYSKLKNQDMDLWSNELNDKFNDALPMSRIIYGQLAVDTPALLSDEWTRPSTKMEELYDMLTELVPISKVVVFSKYAKMCKILHHWLPWPSICYTGELTINQRRQAQERFLTDSGVPIFIMDTAGAEAIDLHGMEKDGVWHQGAEYLIRYDSLWNPDRNAQVEDRIHRVGQKERVTIIEMIAKNTVEEKIRARLMQKTAVIKQIITKTMTERECQTLM